MCATRIEQPQPTSAGLNAPPTANAKMDVSFLFFKQFKIDYKKNRMGILIFSALLFNVVFPLWLNVELLRLKKLHKSGLFQYAFTGFDGLLGETIILELF